MMAEIKRTCLHRDLMARGIGRFSSAKPIKVICYGTFL